MLAATSVSRIGDLGLSAGVVRFVAQALGKNDEKRAIEVIQTVVITLGVFMAVLLFVGYPIFSLILSYLLPEQSVPMAIDILPYALISLWMMMLVSALGGALDGCLRLDLRSYITAVSHIVFLGMTVFLVPQFGLLGVAVAQVVQSVGLLVLLWWALKLQFKQLPIIPLSWKLVVLKDMFHYGVNFQIITLMNMLFDPLVKAMMSKFGGLEALGFYEMANGLILKCRAIIVEANRVVVPSVASSQKCDLETLRKQFIDSYRLTFYVSLILFGSLGVMSTAICVIWLGHYQETFVVFVLLLNLGWFLNTLITPAYFANLGSGELRKNMRAHAIIGSLTALLGTIFGMQFGAEGVLFGSVISLVVGSMYVHFSYTMELGMSLASAFFPEGMRLLSVIAVMLIIASWYGWEFFIDESRLYWLLIIMCLGLLLLAAWVNPMRQAIFSRK